MRDFRGKVAVVTGAASGIGAALVRRLLAEGALVAASDVADLPETGARGYRVDVTSRDALHAHAAEVVADFGRVDLVVNNAGVALKGTVLQMSDEDLAWVLDTNFWGVVHGTRAFLPHLVAGRGSLVNVSSVFGFVGVPGQSAYCSAKFAVRGFTESLRQEMRAAGTGVGVSCVHPGGVRTAIARSGRVSVPADRDAFARSLDKIAMTSPEKAARVIVEGAKRDRARILVGPDARLLDALPRLLGALYQPVLARLLGR